jgi:hypothetical protein
METGQVFEKNKNIVIDCQVNLIVLWRHSHAVVFIGNFFWKNTIGSSLGRGDWTF